MKKSIFLVLILIQIVVISILYRSIQQKKGILGNMTYDPFMKNGVVTKPQDELKYFYEPKPNTISKPEVIFEGLESISYHINNDGFNQVASYSLNKNQGVYRIVTIGDSFTFGSKVNTQDNYPSQLEYMLNNSLTCTNIKKFEVLNLGVGGYDIQYSLERLRRKGLQYNPDIVLWLLIPDDFDRLDELFIPKFSQYSSYAKASGQYEDEIKNGKYDTEWNKAKNEVITQIGGPNAVLYLQKRYLDKINTFYKGPLLMTLLQTPYDKKTDITQYQQLLEDLSQSNKNISIYKNFPNIYESSDTVLPDYHPNKNGHTIIANAFLNYLINNHIIDCQIKK